MVPCQPRQLVILSLPFAALVAFFWFKRRRSLSRSDPGGTAARLRPGDTTAINGKLELESLIKAEVKTRQEEEVIIKKIVAVEGSVENPKEGGAEKSIEGVVQEKEVVCNGSALHSTEEKETENNPIPEFEENRIFHSTIIESEKSEIKEDISELGSQVAENRGKQDQIFEESNITLNSGEEEKGESEEKIQSQISASAHQNTVENISLKAVEEKSLEIPSDKTIVEESNCASTSDTLERVENVSVDTGLGSQDPSAVEDCSAMAQGQKTESDNATGLEQKLASLGLDTSQQPAQRERDSANHSPAEVMLNSPAISTFSDAHSEGSSDSGKGCSDVVTPPSRTPAGGSSVAGDLAHSVYEFVLPQVIVGRLIGRHGAFLQDIRAKTHTNVFIKKHPETNSLKICAIEGTQQDIDAALKMIRQKFPLRRFPDLTLEKVSFVKNTCLPINPENLQLHLVEGVNNDVIVSSVITAGSMFLQMPMHISYQSLYKLACIMNSVYNTQESPPLVEPQPNVVCVVPSHGGWYRAQIMSVDEDTNTSEVKFLDYGGYMTVDNACLRQIRGDFLLLPFQAVECLLANVMPAGGDETWSEEARQFVQLMTTNQTLQAQVYDYTETGLPLVYLYCTQFYQSLTDPSGYETKVVLLNQELVLRGFADLIDTSQEDLPQAAATESS